MASPALNPRNVAGKATAKIDRRLIQRQLRGGGPQLELAAVAVATMAEIAADHNVHSERGTTMVPRRGLVQRTTLCSAHQ
jgi:hypothetical protein